MDSENDDLYLSDGPVSRSGLADGTRSGSDPEDDNTSGSGPGTGLGCGVVSVVSVLFFISLLCSTPSSLFFIILILYICYTIAVDNPLRLVRNVTRIALLAMAVAYLMTYFNTYISMRC